eukprot:1142453-Pelagomonas_calceolata.AAC.1
MASLPVVAPNAAQLIIDAAIQAHGGAGVSQEIMNSACVSTLFLPFLVRCGLTSHYICAASKPFTNDHMHESTFLESSLLLFWFKKQTHHEIRPVRTREDISCGERPPGDVCNGRGHVGHHHHQPHKSHSLGKS